MGNGIKMGGGGGVNILVENTKLKNVKELVLTPAYVQGPSLSISNWRHIKPYNMDVYNDELYYVTDSVLYKNDYKGNETRIERNFGDYICWHNDKLYCGHPSKVYDPSTGGVSRVENGNGSLAEINGTLYLFDSVRIKKLEGGVFVGTGIEHPLHETPLFTRLHAKSKTYLYGYGSSIYAFNGKSFILRTKNIPATSSQDTYPTYTEFYDSFFGISSTGSGTAEKFKAYVYDEISLNWRLICTINADRSYGSKIIRNGDCIGIFYMSSIEYLTAVTVYPNIF